MAMVNVAYTPAEAKEECGEMAPSPAEMPKYPYGLSLSLNDETLAKLGIAMPAVGGKMMLTAMVDVTGTSVRKDQEGNDTCVDLQITDMQLEPAAQAKSPLEQRLYTAGDKT